MTVEKYMMIGVIVAIVGFVLYRFGQILDKRGNKNGALISMVAWLFIIVGVMTSFSFFRVKYLS